MSKPPKWQEWPSRPSVPTGRSNRFRANPWPMLWVVLIVSIFIVILVSVPLLEGENQTAPILFNMPPGPISSAPPTIQENLPLSCACPDPVVKASLDTITIPSSKEATVIIKFVNPGAEDINLSFEYVTLRDPKDGNKVYRGDYNSFVALAEGSMLVPVIFHLNTSHKKMYIFSMSLVKGSYWKHKYQDVAISF